MAKPNPVCPAGLKTGYGASAMDFLTEISTAWSEHWEATVAIMATILTVLALLKRMGKEIQQLGSFVWRWKGWTIVSRLYRKAKTQYRVRRAKSVMRRTLEGGRVRIGIRVYDKCLRDDPSKSTRGQLNVITPAKPFWLNDYYVATALESLSNEGSVVRAKRYYVHSWPPDPEFYEFGTANTDRPACEEAYKIETNDKCLAYQFFNFCPGEPRFERQEFAETVSPNLTKSWTTFPLKDMAPPCELCWENESRERDIRTLVDNITKYDLADIATIEITGTNGELQEAVADICIESPYAAEANLIKPVVKLAVDIRQRQIASCTSRLQYEWRQGEKEELVATLKEYIKSQTVQ